MAGFKILDCVAQRAPGRLIRRIDRLMTGIIEQRLRNTALTYVHWVTLKLIKDGQVSTAGDLARELSYTTGAATRLIDTIETLGFVTRERLLEDRRIVRLALTGRGMTMIAEIHPIVLGAWNEMVADFSQDEANQLIDSLVKLLGVVEAKAAAGCARHAIAEAAE